MMTAIATTRTFDYVFSPVNDLQVVTEENPKTGKQTVSHVLVHDEPIEPTQRFWTSLFARYQFNKSFFKYFDYHEVFDRISDVESNDRMRMCIERTVSDDGKTSNRLLSVSNPTKPVVYYDELNETLKRFDGESINYVNGVVESTHIPSITSRFNVLGDSFENRFIMSTPIDGYGNPSIYLSLFRLICTNGIVGYTKEFRNSLSLGKSMDNVMPSITRALDGFNHDEGFAAIRNRIESAGKSWLSVYESEQLYGVISKLHCNSLLHKSVDADMIVSPIMKSFHKMTGDPSKSYGLANLSSLNQKRQRTLPVACTVYDAINFATEIATHHATYSGARLLQAWVGGCLSDEYDLENTKDKFGEFADFLVDSKIETGMTGSDSVVPEPSLN